MFEKPCLDSGIIKLDIDGYGYEREITIVKYNMENYKTAYWIICEDFLTVSVRGQNGDYFLTGLGAKKYEQQILNIINIFNKELKQINYKPNKLKLVKKE